MESEATQVLAVGVLPLAFPYSNPGQIRSPSWAKIRHWEGFDDPTGTPTGPTRSRLNAVNPEYLLPKRAKLTSAASDRYSSAIGAP
jgi:hypothetical protein